MILFEISGAVISFFLSVGLVLLVILVSVRAVFKNNLQQANDEEDNEENTSQVEAYDSRSDNSDSKRSIARGQLNHWLTKQCEATKTQDLLDDIAVDEQLGSRRKAFQPMTDMSEGPKPGESLVENRRAFDEGWLVSWEEDSLGDDAFDESNIEIPASITRTGEKTLQTKAQIASNRQASSAPAARSQRLRDKQSLRELMRYQLLLGQPRCKGRSKDRII